MPLGADINLTATGQFGSAADRIRKLILDGQISPSFTPIRFSQFRRNKFRRKKSDRPKTRTSDPFRRKKSDRPKQEQVTSLEGRNPTAEKSK